MKKLLVIFVATLFLLLISGENLHSSETADSTAANHEAARQSSWNTTKEELLKNGAARDIRIKRQWIYEESTRCARSIRQKRQYYNPYMGGGIGGFGGFGGGCCCCCCCCCGGGGFGFGKK
ncbi:unnamed protein product [Haemonchus placei]|uniref:Uncharacterized protein n=1 Tax=Haemonchus placei TaxID=6290 RepID=A0A0N4WXL6_HAEPC|nr:unnamed protein product [Haemonchus placei]